MMLFTRPTDEVKEDETLIESTNSSWLTRSRMRSPEVDSLRARVTNTFLHISPPTIGPMDFMKVLLRQGGGCLWDKDQVIRIWEWTSAHFCTIFISKTYWWISIRNKEKKMKSLLESGSDQEHTFAGTVYFHNGGFSQCGGGVHFRCTVYAF